MDLLDLVKMEEYLERTGRKAKPMPKTATPVADAILAKPVSNNMVKSSIDDVGTPFRFNNSQNDNVE